MRIVWLDSARGIAILTVIIFHAFLANSGIIHEINERICSFMIPIFFVISGYLYREKKLPEFIRLRLKRLILPYFSAQIIVTILALIFFPGAAERWNDYLLGIFFADVNLPVKDSLADYPLWFLPCLFLSEVIFLSTQKIFKNRAWLVSILLSAFGIFLSTKIFLPWGADIALTAQIFISGGTILRDRFETYSEKISNVQMILIALIFLATTEINSSIDMPYRIFNNPLLFFLDGMLGSILIFHIARKFSNKFLIFLGRNTMSILILHVPIFFCVEMIVQQFGIDYSITAVCWLKIAVMILLTYRIDRDFFRLSNFLHR